MSSVDQPDEKASDLPPLSPKPESVLRNCEQLVTLPAIFHQNVRLLRSATLEWNGRILRGRKRIVRFLIYKKHRGFLRDLVLVQPTSCEPFYIHRPIQECGAINPKDAEKSMYAAPRGDWASGTKRRSSATHGHDETVARLMNTELPDTEFQTPLRPFVGSKSPPKWQKLGIIGKHKESYFSDYSFSDGQSSSSCTSSDDESSDQNTQDEKKEEKNIEKKEEEKEEKHENILKPAEKEIPQEEEKEDAKPSEKMEEASESLNLNEEVVSAVATVEKFGELKYLRARLSTNLSTSSDMSSSHVQHYHESSVVTASTSYEDTNLSEAPTLSVSYRIHRATQQPYFDQLIFRWPAQPNGVILSRRLAVRRKLFHDDIANPSQVEGTAETASTQMVALPQAPTESANSASNTNEDGTFYWRMSTRTTATRYPSPPATPFKRYRFNTASQGNSRATDETAGTSSSFSTVSDALYAPYGQIRHNPTRSVPYPPASISSTQAGSAAPSTSTARIPFLASHTDTPRSSSNFIRLGNDSPSSSCSNEDDTAKPPKRAAASVASVRKPLRF